MAVCSYCGNKISTGRKACPSCLRSPRKTTERKIPIVNAIIALIFCSAVILGATLAIISRIGAPIDDEGLHLDGTWETESPTHNDEYITFVFAGDSFSTVTESIIVNASPEVLEDIRDFYMVYYGAAVYADDLGDGSFLLRIKADGTFALDGNNILLVSGEGLVRVLSFYWENEAIVINDDRFVRVCCFQLDSFLPSPCTVAAALKRRRRLCLALVQ